MAISKRLRFEIFRRDKHTCQYCGEQAPNVTLHVDHIMPTTLGGDDTPGNLVTACKDCNAGKSSLPPDAPIVEGIQGKAAAYMLGMMDKMTKLRAKLEAFQHYKHDFEQSWNVYQYHDGEEVELPLDYELTLYRWHELDVPLEIVQMAIPKAMNKRGLRGEYGTFNYMAGIVHNMIKFDEIDHTFKPMEAAVVTLSEAQQLRTENYDMGYSAAVTRSLELDFVQHHIDRHKLVRS